MRILIWNINALVPTVKNILLKHGSIRAFFDSHEADIVCFQETKLIDEKLTSELGCVDGFESFWAISQTKKGYSGVATYARHEWSPVAAEIDCLGTLDTELNGEGRVIVTDHSSFVLINVYVPNAGKRGDEMSARADLKIRFLHALKAKCDALRAEGRQVVVVGDLNVAITSKDVHPAFNWARMYHPEELRVMRELLRDHTDVWRLQNPATTDVFTVWDEKTFARSFNKGVRIDYVLVTAGLLAHVGAVRVLDTPPKWSDHAALLAELGGVAPPPTHEPVPQSSRRLKRFDARRQPSIASLFARGAGPRPAASRKRVREDAAPTIGASLQKPAGLSDSVRDGATTGEVAATGQTPPSAQPASSPLKIAREASASVPTAEATTRSGTVTDTAAELQSADGYKESGGSDLGIPPSTELESPALHVADAPARPSRTNVQKSREKSAQSVHRDKGQTNIASFFGKSR